jgi:hypothetical protein
VTAEILASGYDSGPAGGQFLVRMGGGDGRVDPDTGHALQGLVRDPRSGQLPRGLTCH